MDEPLCCAREQIHESDEYAVEETARYIALVRQQIPDLLIGDIETYPSITTVSMEVGSCWYLRLADPHRVVNRGLSDRVHLVIDANVNQWVLDQLRRGSGPS